MEPTLFDFIRNCLTKVRTWVLQLEKSIPEFFLSKRPVQNWYEWRINIVQCYFKSLFLDSVLVYCKLYTCTMEENIKNINLKPKIRNNIEQTPSSEEDHDILSKAWLRTHFNHDLFNRHSLVWNTIYYLGTLKKQNKIIIYSARKTSIVGFQKSGRQSLAEILTNVLQCDSFVKFRPNVTIFFSVTFWWRN